MKPPRAREAQLLRALIADLVRLRRARRMARQDLAAAMGYHWQTVGKWERGETLPSTAALAWWCEALGAKLMVGP